MNDNNDEKLRKEADDTAPRDMLNREQWIARALAAAAQHQRKPENDSDD